MINRATKLFCQVLLTCLFPMVLADDVTIQADQDAAAGLDLEAVGQLIQEIEDIETFERALNDSDRGINNLDLDLDGQVDYIRVVTHDENDTRVLVLQVPMAKDEYQDIATIDIDREDDDVIVQVHGNEHIYGVNYYLYPTGVNWATVGFVSWIYGPHYRPWRSNVVFGVYPSWYRPYSHVHVSVYGPRVKLHKHSTWHRSHETRVVRAHHVHRTHHVSVKVKAPVRNPAKGQVKSTVKVKHVKTTKTSKTTVKHSKDKKGTKVKKTTKTSTKTKKSTKKTKKKSKTKKKN